MSDYMSGMYFTIYQLAACAVVTISVVLVYKIITISSDFLPIFAFLSISSDFMPFIVHCVQKTLCFRLFKPSAEDASINARGRANIPVSTSIRYSWTTCSTVPHPEREDRSLTSEHETSHQKHPSQERLARQYGYP